MKQNMALNFIFLLASFFLFLPMINYAEDTPTFTDADLEKYRRKSDSRTEPTDEIKPMRIAPAPAPAPVPLILHEGKGEGAGIALPIDRYERAIKNGDKRISRENAPMEDSKKPAPVSSEAMNEEIGNTWKSVRLEVVDKLGRHTEEYIIAVGDSLSIPGSSLRIEVISFIPDFMLVGNGLIRSRSVEPNNQAASVVIYDNGKTAYGGWLYANFPTINPFEHERYQVSLKGGIRTASKSLPGAGRIDEPRINQQNTLKTKSNKAPQDQANKARRKLSDSEKNNIISQCAQVWHRYRIALSKGDIEGALKEVSSNSKETFRDALQYARKPEHFGDIRAADIEENIAQFNMTVRDKLRPGDDLSQGHSVGDYIEVESYVNFIKDPTGNWKIDSY